jgi:hypothetical protein
MYKAATERAGARKVVMQSHQKMVIAHYHAYAHDARVARVQRAGED